MVFYIRGTNARDPGRCDRLDRGWACFLQIQTGQSDSDLLEVEVSIYKSRHEAYLCFMAGARIHRRTIAEKLSILAGYIHTRKW